MDYKYVLDLLMNVKNIKISTISLKTSYMCNFAFQWPQQCLLYISNLNSMLLQ